MTLRIHSYLQRVFKPLPQLEVLNVLHENKGIINELFDLLIKFGSLYHSGLLCKQIVIPVISDLRKRVLFCMIH